MLRLVGGTEFKGADGAESAKTEVVEAAPTTKTKAVKVPVTLSPEQKDAARKLILDYVIRNPESEHDMSVRDLIAAAECAATTGECGGSPPIDVFFSSMRALDRLGITLSTGGAYFGLATVTFATVVEPKKLVRHLPQLKKGAADLLGLPLY